MTWPLGEASTFMPARKMSLLKLGTRMLGAILDNVFSGFSAVSEAFYEEAYCM
jgi:hypothetical protein